MKKNKKMIDIMEKTSQKEEDNNELIKNLLNI